MTTVSPGGRTTQTARLVLASASPRRREILTALGIPFDVVVSNADETRLSSETPFEYVQRVARLKADEVASRCEAPFVLGADTTVVLGDLALAKPESDEQARAMLRSLSGKTHEVATGLCLIANGAAHGLLVRTEVDFRPLSEGEIARYVASGEGRDKAGSYAIQGLGGGLVAAFRGSYHNVVGLPAAETVLLLREHGAVAQWP